MVLQKIKLIGIRESTMRKRLGRNFRRNIKYKCDQRLSLEQTRKRDVGGKECRLKRCFVRKENF